MLLHNNPIIQCEITNDVWQEKLIAINVIAYWTIMLKVKTAHLVLLPHQYILRDALFYKCPLSFKTICRGIWDKLQ